MRGNRWPAESSDGLPVTGSVVFTQSVRVASGCGVHMASTQARSFSFTRNTAAETGFMTASPLSTAAVIDSRTGWEALAATLSPLSGTKASRKTIEPMASRIASATPEMMMPP